MFLAQKHFQKHFLYCVMYELRPMHVRCEAQIEGAR